MMESVRSRNSWGAEEKRGFFYETRRIPPDPLINDPKFMTTKLSSFLVVSQTVSRLSLGGSHAWLIA